MAAIDPKGQASSGQMMLLDSNILIYAALGESDAADAVIAATAIENGLVLVTRNIKDFKWIGSLTLLDPFDE